APVRASSLTCTPRSAPSCSARRAASTAISGPIVRAITSASSSAASASCRAASTAFSSTSLRVLSSVVRTVREAESNPRGEEMSGTCLTQTTIRMPPACHYRKTCDDETWENAMSPTPAGERADGPVGEPATARAERPAVEPAHLGVHLDGDGANVLVHAPHAWAVDLCLLW